MTEQEWEDLCDGCGKCCILTPTQFICPGLDTRTRRCSVYETRHETYPCLKVTPSNVSRLNRTGVLPDSCAYVRHEKGLAPLEVEPLPLPNASMRMAHPDIQLRYHANVKEYFRRRSLLPAPDADAVDGSEDQ